MQRESNRSRKPAAGPIVEQPPFDVKIPVRPAVLSDYSWSKRSRGPWTANVADQPDAVTAAAHFAAEVGARSLFVNERDAARNGL